MSPTTRILTAFTLASLFVAATTGGCELISVVDRSVLQGTGGDGGTGGTSSSTGPCACASAADCTAPSTKCVVASCNACTCSTSNAAVGTACDDGGGSVCDGDGTCVGCNDATDCPATGMECVEATCDAGVCGTANIAAGMPSTTQTAGDCLVVVCDGSGSTTTNNDDNDVPNDGTVCTNDSCSGGSAVHNPAAGSCSEGGGQVCGDLAGPKAGQCVECNVSGDCTVAMTGCQANLCVPLTCMDGNQNGGETDQDCGGPDCAPCANNLSCLVATDCQSGVCGANGKCTAPTCSDAIKNQDETDVDCGGTCSGPPSNKQCADTLKCLVAGDCQSGVCNGNPLSCQAPTCSDAVKNGTEGDVDCGAICGMAKLCANAQTCGGAADCASGVCTGGNCAPCANDGNCAANQYCDNALNGGTCVGDQAIGATCTSDAQCLSGACVDGACCSGACTVCQSCNLPGMAGTCSPIAAGQPDTNPANACDSAGTKACDGAGACKGINGAACAVGGDCTSGNCVDGVCCNTTCATACSACNVAGSVGTCSPIAAGQQDNNPVNACTGMSACDGAGACKKSNGQACAGAAECGSNFCVDTVCCNAACATDCFSCNLAGSAGTCTGLPHGSTDGACVAPSACSAAGTCLAGFGATCAANGDCASNSCGGGNPKTCKCTTNNDCPAANPTCGGGGNCQ